MFGGGKIYNEKLKFRECMSDVNLYDINSNKWHGIHTHNNNIITNVRNHACSVIGNFMIVHGGVDE